MICNNNLENNWSYNNEHVLIVNWFTYEVPNMREENIEE